MKTFPTPTHAQRSEREIGRSRFVTTLAPVRDERAAREVLDAARIALPDAVHLRLLVPPSERGRPARRPRELGRGTLELRRADGAADPP